MLYIIYNDIFNILYIVHITCLLTFYVEFNFHRLGALSLRYGDAGRVGSAQTVSLSENVRYFEIQLI